MLKLESFDLTTKSLKVLAVPVCEDKEIHKEKTLLKLVKKAKKYSEFSGNKDDEIILYESQEVKAKRIIFFGLGKFDTLDSEAFRVFAGKVVKKCIKFNLKEVTLAVPTTKIKNCDMSTRLLALQEGAYLGNHLFDKYKEKNKDKKEPLKRINLFVGPNVKKRFKKVPAQVETLCQATVLAREWVNMAPNHLGPEKFAKLIKGIAQKENLKIDVLDEKELEEKKFGALLAVASGSKAKPKLVVLEHKPKNAKKTIVLVGKGVTFDSGGISLKPPVAMKNMKMDMAGAAAVAATMVSTAKLDLKVNLIGVLPLVENMPSHKACRPGDIVTSYLGKTVEIDNTDAEGRLILIDAMAYAIEKYTPNIIIDIATLTGACVMALGERIAGVFSPHEDLTEAILTAGKRTHERCWHMPLPDDYKEFLKSSHADLNNVGSNKWGGAITAALFISEFIGDTKWAHIDIAGPAYTEKDTPYCNTGGTGFGVRLLSDVIGNIDRSIEDLS